MDLKDALKNGQEEKEESWLSRLLKSKTDETDVAKRKKKMESQWDAIKGEM